MDSRLAISALDRMLRSRAFENLTEKVFSEAVQKGYRLGTTHLATGQEACQAGVCLAMEDRDLITTTHRCHGYNICRSSDPYAMFCEIFGLRDGLCKGLGGSMHMSDKAHNNLGSSSVVGSGIPLATGAALSQKRLGTGAVSVCIFGDGAANRGTLAECMNLAQVFSLPLLLFCENNGYAMSARSDKVSCSTPVQRAEGYCVRTYLIDGNDLQSVYTTTREALSWIRENSLPVLIEATTYRLKGHSKNDKRLYRSREEEKEWSLKDPIARLASTLIAQGDLTEQEFMKMQAEACSIMDEALARTLQKLGDTLSESEALELVKPPVKPVQPIEPMMGLTFAQGIRQGLELMLYSDEKAVLIGEDIGLYGGCFGVTGDLCSRHDSQVLETPVSEESFAGMAVGAAMTGLRPIVEVMYADFATLISDAIINHAAKIYYMTGGQYTCPVVFRFPEGAGTGHGPQHTQSPEAMFANTSGLTMLAPSFPDEAQRLLHWASKQDFPILFFESKAMYKRSGDLSRDFKPLEAIKLQEGDRLTIITYAKAARIVMEAIEGLEGIEVIELSTLMPMDARTLIQSAIKTKAVLIVQDPPVTGGIAAEAAAALSESQDLFSLLRHPIRRLGGNLAPVGASRAVEQFSFPQAQAIRQAAISLLD